MKLHELIQRHLESSKEPVGNFAKRAGVNRSTVYRAKAGSDHLLFHLVEGMVRAAGGELKIVTPATPATSPEASQVGGDAA